MYELITLADLKSWQNISGSGDDTFLAKVIDATTRAVELYCNKHFVTRQYTEYHDGKFLTALGTKEYPIYKVTSLWDDTDREYTDSNLQVDTADFVIDYDTGLLKLRGDESVFSDSIGNVRVIYWAGYSRFNVVDESNNYLDVTDSGGTVAIEIAEQTDAGSIWKGYGAEDLASTLQTALNANATLNGTYTVSYSHITQKFTISCDETFSLLWSSGASAAKDLGDLMGYDVSADDTGAATYTADNSVTGIPEDIQLAAQWVAQRMYDDSRYGKTLLDKKSEHMPQGAVVQFVKGDFPEQAKVILNQFRRAYL